MNCDNVFIEVKCGADIDLPAFAWANSAVTFGVSGVPSNRFGCVVTGVAVRLENPIGDELTVSATRHGSVWTATFPASFTEIAGKVERGLVLLIEGKDETGETRTWFENVADFEIRAISPSAQPVPGEGSAQMRYFDEAPSAPRAGNVAPIGGELKLYNGEEWRAFGGGGSVVLDNTVTRTSSHGVKSSGIWGAIWGALTALPTGFTSIYDWFAAQLSKKAELKHDSSGYYIEIDE